MKTATPTHSIAAQMLEDKKQVQDFLKSKDAAKRPQHLKFAALIPVSACAAGKHEHE